MPASAHLLVIEDDPDIARVLVSDLEDAGYRVTHAADGLAALEAYAKHTPELILLDLNLPGLTGPQVLKRLRQRSGVPVIVLTAMDDVDDKIELFELGADDYVVKPYEPRELIARIHVQLRNPSEETLTVGQLVIQVHKRLVTYAGREVRLSPTEFRILEVLARQAGRVFTKEEIERAVWPEGEQHTSNLLTVHLANLRRKFYDVDAYSVLRTVRNVGYALRAS